MKSLRDIFNSISKYIKKYLPRGVNMPHHASSEEIRLILNTNLFRKMNEDELANLVRSVFIDNYSAGDLILEEGDTSKELFIISEGSVRVFVSDNSEHKIPLKELYAGNYFGEQAASGDKVRTRNASIEAITNVSLIKINAKYIYNLLKKDSSLKSLIEERKVDQAVNIVAHASIFRNEIETLLSNVENPHVLEFHNKECIFKAGDKADSVYMVIQGKVKLLIPQINNDNFSVLILNKGHLFGELGVMNDSSRAATAIADGDLRLLAIDGSEFMKDISISSSFKLKIERLQRLYELPLRGTVEQYTWFLPEVGNAIMNIYKLEDGTEVNSIKMLDNDQFSMRSMEVPQAKHFHYDKGDDHVEIVVHEHHLIGIKANSSFNALPELCYMLLDKVQIKDEDVELFKTTGQLKEPVIS